jgi:hypothetical protein
VYRLALQAKDAGPSSDQVDRDDGGSSMSDDEILLRAREAFAEKLVQRFLLALAAQPGR